MRPGSYDSRIRTIERAAGAIFDLHPFADREVRGRYAKQPVFKARLTSDLFATTASEAPASASAQLIYFDGSHVVYSGVTITVYDYMLTGSSSMETGTHIAIFYDSIDSKWWVISGGCHASDWEPEARG